MGTHPIFESDFDCLTERQSKMPKAKKPDAPRQNNLVSLHEDWQPGNVMRLKMMNFMCVNNVEYIFHPKLNWIIGANGTGKSTIVCAMFLVFDGKVKNLGRSTSIAQYINNRKPDAEAFIEVDIYEDTHKIVTITRVWKSSGSNRWQLDKRPTTEASIKTVLQRLNIQVENLLQFLPQEKVSTFNTLSDVERLFSFEEAIMAANRESNLAVIHTKLIKFEEKAGEENEKLQQGRN